MASFPQKGIGLGVPKPLKYLNQHLEVSTFFCVKDDYCCEQTAHAGTCKLSTARHKLDIKRKMSFPQGKDHRGSVIVAKGSRE